MSAVWEICPSLPAVLCVGVVKKGKNSVARVGRIGGFPVVKLYKVICDAAL